MGFRSVVSHHLADLVMAHGTNKDLAQKQYNQKGGNRPAYGTKGYIAKDIQTT